MSSSSAASRPSAASSGPRPAACSTASGPATVTRHPRWPHSQRLAVGHEPRRDPSAADAVGALDTRPFEMIAPPMPELLFR